MREGGGSSRRSPPCIEQPDEWSGYGGACGGSAALSYLPAVRGSNINIYIMQEILASQGEIQMIKFLNSITHRKLINSTGS